MDMEKLFNEARKAADNAYARYSKFRVGAALLCEDGTIITGANVENRSFGLTNCAERSAIFRAISEGRHGFKAIAISTPDSIEPVGPCGACRQVLSEFMSPDALVYFGGSGKEHVSVTLGQLYPYDSLHDLA